MTRGMYCCRQLKPILPGKPDPGDAVSPGERPPWSSMHTMRLKVGPGRFRVIVTNGGEQMATQYCLVARHTRNLWAATDYTIHGFKPAV